MQKDRIPPRPEKPCFACGSDTWYLRVAYGHPEWICGKCHPKPDNDCPGKVGPGDQLKRLQESPLGREPGERT